MTKKHIMAVVTMIIVIMKDVDASMTAFAIGITAFLVGVGIGIAIC